MSIRTRIPAVAFLALIGCVALPAAMTADQAVSADAQANFAKAWSQQPRVDLGIPANGAKVVIVKFNDFMCPSCRQSEVFYKPVLEKFDKSNPGAVKYVVKDWPWNTSCNFNATSTISGHEAACNAAAAARMARDRGKYDEMVEWLYANQGTTAAAVRSAAERILGVKDFDAEYARKLPDIRRDVADGGVLRINSTPTFFINGVRLPEGMIPAAYFELAISLELKRAG
jgi:protein-disulfide isomerase